ncbi:MAG: trehalose-phosphatase, partial [Rhodospirillaceae bacterium]
FLDVDGTLLDIAPRPDLVTVPAELPAILQRLDEALGGALALVSGRSLAALDALLGWGGRDAAGCHGAELRLAGQTAAHAEDEALAARIAAAVADTVDMVPGALLEVKGYSVAFHYRNADLGPARAHDMVKAAIADLRPAVRTIAGKGVVEIVPAHAGKDDAIARILARPPYAGRLPVFAGDDVTDEEGFAFVNTRGGISVSVGGERSQARFRVADPPAMRRWLAALTRVKLETGA